MTVAGDAFRVLVTRSREDAAEIVARLAATGVEIVQEPLLSIDFADGPPPDFRDAQGLIFTSANGVRAFVRRSGERDFPVYAVGDATARAALEAGFATIESAGGNVEDLARRVSRLASPKAGKLLHIAGSVVAGDLSGRLAEAGFAVDRHVMYDARVAETFSTRTISALREGEIDAVLLFSPRTARTFVGLADRLGLAESCIRIDACCLSSAVAREAGAIAWRRMSVADEPTLDALLDIVNEARVADYGGR